jgi:uncharacterized membrane protein (UPF0127 family)
MRSAALVLSAIALVACAGDDDASSTTTPAVELSTSTSTTSTTTSPPRTTAVETTARTASTAPAASTAPTMPSSSPTTVAPTTATAGVVVPEGFEQVAATATAADGTVCELCLWLAANGDQRARGLMYVTDLGGPDGMIFRYDSPHTSAFWMKNTVMPLSIAFFDQGGAYLDAFDMAPCSADPCPLYPTPENFVNAIEVPQGMLDELAIAPGSVLAVSDLPCGGG